MSERKLRMQTAAKGLKVRGCDQYTINRINGIGLEIAELNPGKSRAELKRIIKDEAKKRLRQKYGFISWGWFVLWVLPKVVEWFVVWLMRDRHEQINKAGRPTQFFPDACFQHKVDQARGDVMQGE